MLAMVLQKPSESLRAWELPTPTPNVRQVLIEVSACAVCRTDLHVVDGELPNPKLPLIPGHQIVGTVVEVGEGVTHLALGDRVGVPWLGWTCGECGYCRQGRENLCEDARFTGYQIDGGYAEFAVADERYCFSLPAEYPDLQAAPLLCAGLVGYRSLRMTGEADRVLWFWRGSTHPHPGRPPSETTSVCLHSSQRCGGTAVCCFPRRGVGWRHHPATPGAARCCHHLRPVGGTGSPGPAPHRKRRSGGLRWDSHVGHSFIPIQHSVGRTRGQVGGEHDAARWGGISRDCTEGPGADRGGAICADSRE